MLSTSFTKEQVKMKAASGSDKKRKAKLRNTKTSRFSTLLGPHMLPAFGSHSKYSRDRICTATSSGRSCEGLPQTF